MNLVLGSRGRLGSALLTQLGAGTTVALPREIYAPWCEADCKIDLEPLFVDGDRPGIVFIAAGLTDPSLPGDELQRVNGNLPINVIAAAQRCGARVITFGTIMEEIVAPGKGNAYIESKRQLGGRIAHDFPDADILHIRIHTLYGGGPPERFMFLGQMLAALQQRDEFRMSPGHQLREYHHVDDDASAIVALAQSDRRGFVNLSHGRPVQLRDLAAYVCGQLGHAERLRIGALPAPADENYGAIFARPAGLADGGFRETLPSVLTYLGENLQASRP